MFSTNLAVDNFCSNSAASSCSCTIWGCERKYSEKPVARCETPIFGNCWAGGLGQRAVAVVQVGA